MGTFAFVGFRRSPGPKGVPDQESPRGTHSASAPGTWEWLSQGILHPPKTQACPVIANRPQQLGNFARNLSSAKADGPFKGCPAYLCSACPARCPSLTAAVSARVRVAASRLPPAAAGLPRLGDLPRAPRPAGVPTRDPDSPGFLKVSGIPPKRSCNLS